MDGGGAGEGESCLNHSEPELIYGKINMITDIKAFESISTLTDENFRGNLQR